MDRKIVCLVLGCLGVVFSFIPGVSFVGWVIALISIILSNKEMKKAKAVEQKPDGMIVAGLVLGIVGFLIAIPVSICVITRACAMTSAASRLYNLF